MTSQIPPWVDPDEDFIGPNGDHYDYVVSYEIATNRVLVYLHGVMAQAESLNRAALIHPGTAPSIPLVDMIKQVAGLALARNDIGAAADLLEACHQLMQDEVLLHHTKRTRESPE